MIGFTNHSAFSRAYVEPSRTNFKRPLLFSAHHQASSGSDRFQQPVSNSRHNARHDYRFISELESYLDLIRSGQLTPIRDDSAIFQHVFQRLLEEPLVTGIVLKTIEQTPSFKRRVRTKMLTVAELDTHKPFSSDEIALVALKVNKANIIEKENMEAKCRYQLKRYFDTYNIWAKLFNNPQMPKYTYDEVLGMAADAVIATLDDYYKKYLA